MSFDRHRRPDRQSGHPRIVSMPDPTGQPIDWGSALCEQSLLCLVTRQVADLTSRLPAECQGSPACCRLVVAAWCLVHVRCHRRGVPAEAFFAHLTEGATDTARKAWWPVDIAPLLPGLTRSQMSALRRLTVGTPQHLGFLPAWYGRVPETVELLSSWAYALVQCDPAGPVVPDRTCVAGRVRTHLARHPDSLADDLDAQVRARAMLGLAG